MKAYLALLVLAIVVVGVATATQEWYLVFVAVLLGGAGFLAFMKRDQQTQPPS